MNDKPHNHDYETGYRRPAAWRKAKEALVDCATTRILFRRMERIAARRSARLDLDVAMHLYTSLTPAARLRATQAYHHWHEMVTGTCANHHATYGTPLREAPAAEMLGQGEPAAAADDEDDDDDDDDDAGEEWKGVAA